MKRFFKFVLILLMAVILIFGIAVAVLPLPGTVTVLVYHFLGSPEDAKESKNFVSQDSFEQQMLFLHLLGYRVISLDELYAIKTGEVKSRGREVVITFDDGNFTFASGAYPILKKYDFPAAIFLVSESVKRQLHGSMNAETVEDLLHQGGVTVGSHSKTHPFLSEMKGDQIREEITESKRDLEALFNIPVRYFAYPFGAFNRDVIDAVKRAGYQLAFTTSHKKLHHTREGPFAITRTKMTRTSDYLGIYWFKVSGIYNYFKSLRHRLKTG